ncbi:MAG: hypothetical protein ACYTGX_12380 [Planctomycetota bacterium]
MEYSCYACDHAFEVALDRIEIETAIAENRRDRCPECERIVGRGSIVCWSCRTHYEARVPHWHKGCNLAIGDCPTCGRNAGRGCICKNIIRTSSGRFVKSDPALDETVGPDDDATLETLPIIDPEE